MPLLTRDDWRTMLARCLDAAGEEASMKLVGFVFMPEHVHLLVYPTVAIPDMGFYLARIKQPFSKLVKGLLIQNASSLLERLTVRERPGKTCFRFWQEGPGFDRNLFNAQAIEASLDYLHNNPVNRGLCRNPIDWRWSSARYYLEVSSRQYPDLPHVDGLPDGSLDR